MERTKKIVPTIVNVSVKKYSTKMKFRMAAMGDATTNYFISFNQITMPLSELSGLTFG